MNMTEYEKKTIEKNQSDLLAALASISEAVKQADFLEYHAEIDAESESVGTSDG